MASFLTKSFTSTCKARLFSCASVWKTQKAGAAGKAGKTAAGKAAAPTAKKKGLGVEEDTNILLTRLCGGNIYKEGEDPVLKDDSEYPDWLWNLKLSREPVPLEEMSEDDPKYWKRLKKMTIQRKLKLKKHEKL